MSSNNGQRLYPDLDEEHADLIEQYGPVLDRPGDDDHWVRGK